MKRKAAAFLLMPFIAALAASQPALLHAEDAPDSPQALRKAEMEFMKVNLGSIVAVTKGDVKPADPADFLTRRADALYGVARNIPTLFPEGAEGGKAKADIWKDFDGFTARADALAVAVADLRQAAATGDVAAVGDKLKAVGGACGACHKAYRE